MGRPLVAQIVIVEKEMGNTETLGLCTLDDVGDIMEATEYKATWKGRGAGIGDLFSKAATLYSWSLSLLERLGRPRRKLETQSLDLENMGSRSQKERNEATPDPSTDTQSSADNLKTKKIYTTEAPNILLNLHGGTSLTILIPAAIVGILLQIGVLTFAGLASEWPQFALELPSSESATNYGFPLLLLGTVFLTAGLFIVTLVIEQSTEEMRWAVKGDGTNTSSNVQVVWLQREHVVGDQAFDSYLLIQNKKCTEVLTSRRAKISVATGKQDFGGLNRSFFTLLGTVVGLIGFVCQFQGFRSVHWLCAIVQLGATGIMTLIRALIRGGFAVNPEVESVDKDREIDELALMLAKDDRWLSKDSVLKTTSSACKMGKEPAPAGFGTPQPHTTDESTAVASGELSDTEEVLESEFQIRTEHLAHLSYLDDAIPADRRSEEERYGQRTVDIGCRLRDMTRWKAPISETACGVATAIKFMMDEFLIGQKYLWIFDLQLDGRPYHIRINVASKTSDIDGKRLWNDLSNKIESILSLWNLDMMKAQRNRRDEPKCETEIRDASRNRAKQPNRFILGSDSNGTSREISWWSNGQLVPDVIPYSNLSNCGDIHGFLGTKDINCKFCKPSLPLERGDGPSVLCVTSRANDNLILAQHLFSAFMWSFANHLPFDAFSRDVSVSPRPGFEIRFRETWTSVEVMSPKLKRIVQAIHLTGLGTEQEVLSIFIPPLIERNILTGQFVVDLVVRECNKIQAKSNYGMCFKIYEELMALVTPGARELLTCKVLAVCIELMSTSWPMNGPGSFETICYEEFLKKMEAYLAVDFPDNGVHSASCANDSPKDFRTTCLNKIRQLYFGQGRQKDFEHAMKTSEAGTSVDFAQKVDARGSAEMHCDSVLGNDDCRLFGMNESQLTFSHGSEPSIRDILGWTSRHYAASLDSDHSLRQTTDIDLLDIASRSPFHYFTSAERISFFRIGGDTVFEAVVDRDGIPWLMRVLMNTILSQDKSMALQFLNSAREYWPAQLSQVDKFGRTWTHVAIQMMQKELVLELLECRGSDPSAEDKRGQSLLVYACLSAIAAPSMLEIVSALLGRGADVDASDEDHQTALLHTASVEPDSETQSIDMSVESGQSSTEGTNKKSPRQKESRFSNALKVAELLLKHGAKVESESKKHSPLTKARELWDKREGNSPLMVNLLEEGLKKARRRDERDKITRYYNPLRLSHSGSSSSPHNQ